MRFSRNRNFIDLDDDSLILRGLLFFWKPKGTQNLVMSIGAPSSPRLSNRMMYDIDNKINELCCENFVNYTRYADDLSFSTNRPDVLQAIYKGVVDIVDQHPSPDLEINKQKTVWTSRKHRRMVTGVTLTHDRELSIGRQRKRQVRAALHRFSLGQLSNEEVLKLKGELAFATDVEPSFVVRMKSRYGRGLIEQVQKYESNKDR